MALKKYSPRVPREYQEIEYLKCNGTQYIDTGLVGSDLTDCEVEIVMRNDSNYVTYYNFNGAYLSGSTAQLGLVATEDSYCRASLNFGFENPLGVTGLLLSQFHSIYATSGLQKVDGVTIDTLDFGSLTGQNFLLFARTQSNDSSITYCVAMSLKVFTVKRNGSYIRYMIPVRRISDGELGLYDTANNVFYTNQGTNSFIAGSDVDNWHDIPYRRYETATDVVTSLPVKLYGDGETDISLLLKGNTETSGTPSSSNPITINGVGEKTANLFDKDRTQGIIANAYINQSGEQVSSQSYYMSYPINVIVGSTYTWSFVSMTGAYHTAPTVVFYNDNDEMIGVASHNPSIAHFTFTVPNNTKYLRASVYIGFSQNTNMLLEGSTTTPDGTPLDYIPYGYEISILNNGTALTPVYLTEQLMQIDDRVDTVSSSGTLTRNLRKYVFTGEESILIYTSSITGIGFQLNFSHMLSNSRTKGYCTHFKPIFTPSGSGVDGITFGASNTMIYCTFSAESVTEYNLTDITSIKQWLKNQYDAGTPVTIYYVLATAQTESVTVPEITTTGGTATIDVDTTVKPSELDLTYHGWHTHEPLKRENGAWE